MNSFISFIIILVLGVSTTTITVASKTSTTACDGDWYEIPLHGCFLFEDTYMSWYEAQSFCEKNDGYLAEITDAELHATVTTFMKMLFGGINAWSGGNDIGNEGTWKWIHSGKNITQAFWESGRPTDNEYDNCLRMQNWSHYPDTWYDNNCDTEIYVVCQKPAIN